MKRVLALLNENQLYAKMLKCTFGREEVNYLGHMISSKGIKVDPEKIKAISDWPKAINISKLRVFLKLTEYYRRFIQNYAHITTPLTNLLKKNSFQWNNQGERYFKTLKTIMFTILVLATLEF